LFELLETGKEVITRFDRPDSIVYQAHTQCAPKIPLQIRLGNGKRRGANEKGTLARWKAKPGLVDTPAASKQVDTSKLVRPPKIRTFRLRNRQTREQRQPSESSTVADVKLKPEA
jgi:hypothetical protein